MTRRDMLLQVLGAVAAAAVAPLIDLTDMTPNFWNQAPLKQLWRITWPDRFSCMFEGIVVAEKILDNNDVQLTIQPSGAMLVKTSDEETYNATSLTDVGALMKLTGIERQPVTDIDLMDHEPPMPDIDTYVLSGLNREPMSISFTMKPFKDES